ncbi:MAG: YceD family protein [Sedimenticola sp.]|nr:YceD family protein [Sedimenticola sp.]
MSSRLPEFADPRRLASQGSTFSGRVPLADLPRLREALLEPVGEAGFRLEFYLDPRKRPRIRGEVRADLVLQCQRCLSSVVLPVDTALNLAVIEVPEEADRLPDEVEPVWVEEDTLRLMDLVEDELILAIPQVPRHEEDQCKIDWQSEPAAAEPDEDQQTEGDDKPNPFAVLAGIKSDKQS